MTDWHTHILPGMDDGSKSTDESIKMLKMIAHGDINIENVVATSHFYADNEDIDTFIKRRNESYRSLEPFLSDDLPKIKLGAEVRYYRGISHAKKLHKLCIEDTNLLLLEMPSGVWQSDVCREVMSLSSGGDYRIVFAHIDRYMSAQNCRFIDTLTQYNVLVQYSANNFIECFKKAKAFSLLRNRKIHLIGSDCHNTEVRKPMINEAYSAIGKKLGSDCLNMLSDYDRLLTVEKN